MQLSSDNLSDLSSMLVQLATSEEI
jgi:hypothetical protein